MKRALLAPIFLLYLAVALEVGAQEQAPTKLTETVRQHIFADLQDAQLFIEKKQYAKGHERLSKLQAVGDLSAYENAQIWNLTAYAYYLQEKYRESIDAYKRVLSSGTIPPALEQSSLKTLAQLYFTVEDYRGALAMSEKLLAKLDDASAEIYLLVGQAHFQLGQYQKAEKPIKRAIAKYRTAGRKPQENWLLLLRAIYYESKNYAAMAEVLKQLIAAYPKPQYLLTLGGVYSELGDTVKQLAVTEALYEGGLLSKPEQLINLANLYLLNGVPFKAAKLLQKELDEKKLPANGQNLRLVSQAWFQARENEKAIPALAEAATVTGDGELYLRLAQSYINLSRWSEAVDAIHAGMAQGGLRRSDTAQLMLGMALFNQHMHNAARKAFVAAAEDPRSAKTANQWISYVDSEIQRARSIDKLSAESPNAVETDSAPE